MIRLLAGLTLMVALFASAEARAGSGPNPISNCYKYSDGSGYCYGNLAGWRANADPVAFANFYDYGTGYGYFYASLNGQSYSCQTSLSGTYPSVYALWPQLSSMTRFFSISWNASGTCTSAAAVGGTEY